MPRLGFRRQVEAVSFPQPDRPDVPSLEAHAREQFAIGDKAWQTYRGLHAEAQEERLAEEVEAKRASVRWGCCNEEAQPQLTHCTASPA
ncbi:Tar ligand binding domain-containing protein [Paraburkholderia sp.]|uniref:Tar ligand binding domain-containing protein n=1 Tax=Paraburkholderia sp. TaxID=1926495 RepID=UPI002AFF7223|nr:Tar ligand binding domain-containing protein [Paraburkholderia sp.]